jgi:hypothetical protein
MTFTTCVLTRSVLALALLLAAAPIAADHERSTPVITGVEPARPVAGPDTQTLTVTGDDFLPGLTVEVRSPDGQARVFGGADVQRRQNTRFDVSVQFPTDGRYALIVTNEDGGVSEPFAVTVLKAAPAPNAPVIAQVVPNELQPRPEPQTVRVHGERFAPGLAVLLTDPTGAPLPDVAVANVTATSFTVTARFETAGDFELVATNPSGATSNVALVSVR